MEKIVTHPLYIRCKKVIESCRTINQKDIARKYKKLCKEKMDKEYQKTTTNFKKIQNYNFDLDYYFEKLWC